MFLLIQATQAAAATLPALQPLRISRSSQWFTVDNVSGSMQARLRARRPYPGTFCQQQPDGSVLLGYGPLQPRHDEEFLHVRLTPDGGVSIQRDLLCTLPLFY